MIKIIIFILTLVLSNHIFHKYLAKLIYLSWYNNDNLINVNGKNVHVQIKGKGKPLFLIHGSQMNQYDWRYNIDYFSKHYKVYAVDMIGSGFSDKPKAKYTPKFYAEFILQLLNHFEIDKASFIGSSWGGGYIYYFYLLNPNRVDKMVMSSPSGCSHKRTLLEKLLRTKFIGEMLMLLGNKRIIRYELKNMVTNKEIVTKSLINSIFKPIYMKGGMHAVLSAYRHDDFSFVEKNLHKINRPVLIIWGEDDLYHSYAKMKKMRDNIPNAKLIKFKNSGHLPHEEKAEEFNKIAKEFLD